MKLVMLDFGGPSLPMLVAHVGKAGAYAVQLVDESAHHMRWVHVAAPNTPQTVQDYLYGYQTGPLFVGQNAAVVELFSQLTRLPLQ